MTTDARLCIGIDIGTARSAVAVWQDGRARLVPNAEGQLHTPSVVTFDATGTPVVGSRALDLAVLHPQRSFHGFKHLFGLAGRTVAVDGRHWSPEDLAVLILEKLKADAEAHLGATIDAAVLTAPVAFALQQRQTLEIAARRVGIRPFRIIDEPVAAALALHHRLAEGQDETYLVFDLGGGTLDISIVEIGDGVYEVKAVAGDTQLGGADWDIVIATALADAFEDETGLTLAADPVAWQRLLLAAERAKVDLTSTPRTSAVVPHIARDDRGTHHLEEEVSRDQVERWSAPLIDRCRRLAQRTVVDSVWDPDPQKRRSIEPMRPVLVGGGSRLFCIPSLVEDVAGRPSDGGTNPEEAVATGAALEAAVMRGLLKDTLLLPVLPTTIGLSWELTRRTLIRRNTTTPTRRVAGLVVHTDAMLRQPIFLTQGDPDVGQALDVVDVIVPIDVDPGLRVGSRLEIILDVDANTVVHWDVRSSETGRTASGSLSRTGAANARRAWRQHFPGADPALGGGAGTTPTGPGHGLRQVFISYSTADRPYVERLVRHLADHGLRPWWDRDIEVGEQSLPRLVTELEASGAVVLVMSPHAERSVWVARELGAAQDAETPIVPLLVAGQPLFQVRELQHEDVTDGALPSDRLIARLQQLCRPPA